MHTIIYILYTILSIIYNMLYIIDRSGLSQPFQMIHKPLQGLLPPGLWLPAFIHAAPLTRNPTQLPQHPRRSRLSSTALLFSLE